MLLFQNPNVNMILIVDGTHAIFETRKPEEPLSKVINRALTHIKRNSADTYHQLEDKVCNCYP